MARAVFLDRDGVLNRCEVRAGKPYAPRTFEDFRLLPGVCAAVETLRAAGLRIIVFTNQPDIGNGLVEQSVVEAMHDRLRRRIAPDDILVCPHKQSDGCACRKPRPGMLIEAAKRWRIDLAGSYVVGDRWSDIVAGQKAGCYTVFIERFYTESSNFHPHAVARNLPHAARLIVSEHQKNSLPRGRSAP